MGERGVLVDHPTTYRWVQRYAHLYARPSNITSLGSRSVCLLRHDEPEATRHLWNARLDPRRRTYAVGSYTHLLDQWTVIYDQPIVLNRRQVAAAIEGAMRQRHVELERLAVDTHGFTYFGMAIAKLLGLDPGPRLADLSDRKLFVPRGIQAPTVLDQSS